LEPEELTHAALWLDDMQVIQKVEAVMWSNKRRMCIGRKLKEMKENQGQLKNLTE